MPSFSPRSWIACLGLMLLVVARPASAQSHGGPPTIDGERPVAAGQTPTELEGIGIEDRNGATLPRDIQLTGSDGRTVALGEYMDDERPLLLVLAYYGCPMLCSMVLNGTIAALKGMNEAVGASFRVLVVSFDPRDTVAMARDKRASYLTAYGRDVQAIGGSLESSFEFALASEAEVQRLADAVGFRYRWDEAQQQYAHAAGDLRGHAGRRAVDDADRRGVEAGRAVRGDRRRRQGRLAFAAEERPVLLLPVQPAHREIRSARRPHDAPGRGRDAARGLVLDVPTLSRRPS